MADSSLRAFSLPLMEAYVRGDFTAALGQATALRDVEGELASFMRSGLIYCGASQGGRIAFVEACLFLRPDLALSAQPLPRFHCAPIPQYIVSRGKT